MGRASSVPSDTLRGGRSPAVVICPRSGARVDTGSPGPRELRLNPAMMMLLLSAGCALGARGRCEGGQLRGRTRRAWSRPPGRGAFPRVGAAPASPRGNGLGSPAPLPARARLDSPASGGSTPRGRRCGGGHVTPPPRGGAGAGAAAAGRRGAGSAMSLRERSAGGAAAVEAGEDAAATLAEPDGPDRCLSLLPWDRFSAWLHCVCVVGFDLELGQAVEVREAAGAARLRRGAGRRAGLGGLVGTAPCGGGRLCGRAPPESGTSSGAGVARRRGKLGGVLREM